MRPSSPASQSRGQDDRPAPAGDSTVDLPAWAFMGTGSSTAFGKIPVGLSERQAETAFQAGLRGFSKLLVAVAAVLTTSIFVINVALHRPLLEALLFSLAIAIGITPQLLPAIVSVSLSSGSRQLARRRVLVKRLVTIEDLGNIEVLFTDKTGTLTEGAISFDQASTPPTSQPGGRCCWAYRIVGVELTWPRDRGSAGRSIAHRNSIVGRAAACTVSEG
jgi:P-type Mg2+ transporter